VRYAWAFARKQEMTLSYRYREEKEQLAGALRRWNDNELSAVYR